MKILSIELSKKRRKEEFIKSVKQYAKSYFIANMQQISNNDFVQGLGLHNHRCFFNAVEQASRNKGMTVHLVFCIDNSEPDEYFLHVINKTKDDKWQDNTMGYFFRNHEYYYIKECLPDSWPVIWQWFENIRKAYIIQFGVEKEFKKSNLEPHELF